MVSWGHLRIRRKINGTVDTIAEIFRIEEKNCLSLFKIEKPSL